MPPDALVTLYQIRHAIEVIKKFIAGKTRDDYLRDNGLRSIVERHFITIGEAMTRLRAKHPSIYESVSDAKLIISFRNLLVHAYDYIDDDRVWLVANRHLPILKAEVDDLMRDHPLPPIP